MPIPFMFFDNGIIKYADIFFNDFLADFMKY